MSLPASVLSQRADAALRAFLQKRVGRTTRSLSVHGPCDARPDLGGQARVEPSPDRGQVPVLVGSAAYATPAQLAAGAYCGNCAALVDVYAAPTCCDDPSLILRDRRP